MERYARVASHVNLMEMTTSIIMPVHIINEELFTLTIATINSIGKTHDKKNVELIIIDNASSVGGDILIKVAGKYLRNSENRGYPKSINQGTAIAEGELLAIANNDIRVSPGWLGIAKEIFGKDKRVGSVHFRMIDYDEPMQLGDRTWITGKERWCTASFFVIRKEAFVGYDEGYGLGGYDDWDFFHRMRHVAGWKTAYTTRACYQHKHSSTQIAIDDGSSRESRDKANRELFKLKYGRYAEEIWQEKYPEQMSQDYYSFFKEV